MSPAAAYRTLTGIATALDRAQRLHRSGRPRHLGEPDDPEGMVQIRISDTAARVWANRLREIAEEVNR